MIYKLTDKVWWGNWEGPFECIGQVQTIINVAHHFSPRRGRSKYWAMLEKIPHEVFYVRLAKKDRQDIDREYFRAFRNVVFHARDMGKLPILTHCQMGGHRGPTSAIVAAWLLDGGTAEVLDRLHKRALELFPKLANGSNYYHSSMQMCRENCEA